LGIKFTDKFDGLGRSERKIRVRSGRKIKTVEKINPRKISLML